MNVRIVELIFMEKDEREFSLMSEAHEKIVFCMVRDSEKPFHSCLLNRNQTFCFERSIDEASKNNTRYLELITHGCCSKDSDQHLFEFFQF